jgi:hypothetical protein
MAARVRENLLVSLLAGGAAATVAWLTLYGFAWNDYDNEAAPAYAALVSGHIIRFLQLAPAYGGSLIERAPFAVLPALWGGGALAVYRLAAFPCLLASVLFGVWLVARMRASGRTRLARSLALFLCVANPMTLPAMEIGHPEELLGAVLCVVAVLLALEDRALWAGVVLGLAVANKDWALVAAGPVLLALSHRRLAALAAAGATTALVLAPLLAVQAGGFTAATTALATRTGPIFQPWQLWWFLGSHGQVVRGTFGAIKPGYRTPPAWLGTFPHVLIVALVVPLTWLRARQPRTRDAALLLLALLLLLRCALDPWNTDYYALPFLFALLTWETMHRAEPAVLTLAASFAAWAVMQWLPVHASADAQALAFALVTVPALALLGLAVYAPGVLARAPALDAPRTLPGAA